MTSDRTLIVGAGLAGACAALHLAGHGPVTVLDTRAPGEGTSGAAAGLVNPFMGQKARPAWRFEEALSALHAALDSASVAGLFRPTGVLRPARDARQAEAFRERAAEHPAHATWLPAEAADELHPEVQAPHGALWIPNGGAIDLPAMIRALLAASGAEVRSRVRVATFEEENERAWVETETGERIGAARVLLAVGDGFRHVPELAALPLHRVKGQTVRVTRPGGFTDLPSLSGLGYVVPGGDSLLVGSTYEHAFDHTRPTAEATADLLARAARMVPALAEAQVLEARAGVRVTAPTTHSPQRLPLIGPLPGRRRVWAFLGLGSKGLLTAPLLARDLSSFLRDTAAIPPAVRLRAADAG